MNSIIAANWKMNFNFDQVVDFLNDVYSSIEQSNAQIILSPSYCYLNPIKSLIPSNCSIAAQNISEFSSGAYTGNVSAEMVKSCGASYAIIGHSECRHLFGETNKMIQEKLNICKDIGLKPIFCVGETIEQRNNNDTYSVINDQLSYCDFSINGLIIAYEPVWAIGTGKTATPEIAQNVHQHIRSMCGENIPILYGGSVKANNIASLLEMSDINGALIGGASLVAQEFKSILNITHQSVMQN